MNISHNIWNEEENSRIFLDNVRQGIPLYNEQLDIMVRIIKNKKQTIEKFLDIGCGNGILGQAILRKFPVANGVFFDCSEFMIEVAKSQLKHKINQLNFIIEDFGQSEWIKSVEDLGPFDVIVSGFAIHHQSDEKKKEVYQAIYNLLNPGGLFLNLEHIAAKYSWTEKIFEELFIDYLYSSQQAKGSNQSRDEVAQDFYFRPDKQADIFAPLDTQCEWLEKSGFIDVDCFFKVFEIALFGGFRPPVNS